MLHTTRFILRRFASIRVAICAGLLAITGFANAETRLWTGGGGDPLWSNPANWSNGVPTNGDSVLLPRHPVGFSQSAANDLTNLSLVSLRCEATSYTLSGGTLRLTESVLMGGAIPGAFLTISAPVDIPGPTLAITSTNSSELTLSGVVTAPTTATVSVDGGLRFRAIGGGYFATTRLLSGSYALLFTRIEGPVIVGGAEGQSASMILQSGNLFGNFPPVTVLSNSSVFNVSTFQSIGPLTVEGGTVRLGNRSPQGEITVNGPALLHGGAKVFVSSINPFGPGLLSVTGTVTLADCSLAFQPGSSTISQPAVIVSNDGVDPINGTFTGLPEGTFLTNGLARYRISYVGGDGNDITLSPVIEAAKFIGATQTDDGVEYLVEGQVGFAYVVEATTNLLSTDGLIPWVPIRTNTILSGDTFSFNDPEFINFRHRFYRVVKP